MARKGKLAALNRALAAAAAKAPREGFFSTLDELIQEAPFEKGSKEQWLGYLKPGRTLQREDVKFPLKKEEIDYSNLEGALRRALKESDQVSTQDLLTGLRDSRPQINSTQYGDRSLGDPPTYPQIDIKVERERRRKFNEDIVHPGIGRTYGGRTNFNESNLAHHNTALPDSYLEDVTRSPDFGVSSSHFSPTDLSWSRSTQQPLGDGNDSERLGQYLHLVEEIQSDRHSKAAQKVLRIADPELRGELANRNLYPGFDKETIHEALANSNRPLSVELTDRLAALNPARRGYGPQYHEALKEYTQNRLGPSLSDRHDADLLQEFESETGRHQLEPVYVPDTPFKDPADYGRLELKKQLLNAIEDDSDYLGITTPKMQIDRYGGPGANPQREVGMNQIYGQVYPSELEKLARQYGIEMEDVPMTVKKTPDWRPDVMQDVGSETATDFLASLSDGFDKESEWPLMEHELHAVVTPLQRALDNVGTREAHVANSRLAQTYEQIDQDNFGDFSSHHYTSFHDAVSDAEKILSMHGKPETQMIRSMSLTPEAKEKIGRIGVPLWSLVGAGALGSQLPPDDQEYGKGGKVNGLKNVLKMLKDEGMHPEAAFGRNSPSYLELLDHPHFSYPEAGSDDFETLAKHAYGLGMDSSLPALMEKYGIYLPPQTELYRGAFHDGGTPAWLRKLRIPGEEVKLGPARLSSVTPDRDIAKEFATDPGYADPSEYMPELGTLMDLIHPQGVRALPNLISGQSELLVPSEGYRVRTPEKKGRVQVVKKAEGGEIHGMKNVPGKTRSFSSKALQMLREGAVAIGSANAADKRKRLALGLASQLFGADEQGDPTLDFRPDATRMLMNLAQKGSTGYEGNVPGLVDSALSLGSLPAAIASGLTGDQYRGPAISERAQSRVDALDSSLHRDYNLSPASTPGDVFAESLGMMLGQFPLKGPKVAKKFGEEAIDLGRKGILSGLEFLSPTIVARPENYLIGASFPTATSTPEFEEAMQSEPVQSTLEALKKLIRKSEERKK